MSDTIVDMPKVTQMLDNGWSVRIFKNELGGYTAVAEHDNLEIWCRARDACYESLAKFWKPEDAMAISLGYFANEGTIDAADFTPEQALIRLAYKVHGELI